MKTWRPIPIDQYFSDDPDILDMWKVLQITEEKQVPISGDDPIAKSDIVDLKGIHRHNFRPRTNFNHLLVVAKAIGVKSIPTDQGKAFRYVLSQIKNEPILPEPNANMVDTINPELRDSLNEFLSKNKNLD